MKLYLFLILLITFKCYSQNDSLQIRHLIVSNEDTLVLSSIKEVEILNFKKKSDQIYFNQLKKKTLKVYPFAQLASKKLDNVKSDLIVISKKRKKRKYIKSTEKWIKNDLADELKKLSRWEGRILSKLIYRETNISTYNIIKELRGGLHAFFWQGMAKVYDNNLKVIYEPTKNKEDKLIEFIITQAKENGTIK